MEPNYSYTNLLMFAAPFACYFFGIVVRKIALPGKNSPALSHQILLGVPISLVVVSPMIPVLSRTMSDIPALLVSLDVIIEQGMLVDETASA